MKAKELSQNLQNKREAANITGAGEDGFGKQLANMVEEGSPEMAQYFGMTPQHGMGGLFGNKTLPNMAWMQNLAKEDPEAFKRALLAGGIGTAGGAGTLAALMSGGGGGGQQVVVQR